MNRVECQVSDCAFYSDDLCSLHKINVDGPAAKEESQTCCASFMEESAQAQNSVGSDNARGNTDIKCEAENCTYNDNRNCHADGICIDCQSDHVSTKSGTKCATFEER